jgi:nitroreductase / dihydropteridine reductase
MSNQLQLGVNMNYIENLNWRYATKKMNGKTISEEALTRILESIRLSASSFGAQPYKVLVISNPELRKKIAPAIQNQPQIISGSHVLIFCVWSDFTEVKIDEYISLIASERNIPTTSLEGFKKNMMGMAAKSLEDKLIWMKKQCYIGLGSGLMAAALESVDATPMEGFNPEALDLVLELEKLGLKSTVILTLGYRDDSDNLAKLKKVRRAAEDFFLLME